MLVNDETKHTKTVIINTHDEATVQLDNVIYGVDKGN